MNPRNQTPDAKLDNEPTLRAVAYKPTFEEQAILQKAEAFIRKFSDGFVKPNAFQPCDPLGCIGS